MCTNDKSLCKIVVCPATLKLRMSYITRMVENKPTFRAQLIIELSKHTGKRASHLVSYLGKLQCWSKCLIPVAGSVNNYM